MPRMAPAGVQAAKLFVGLTIADASEKMATPNSEQITAPPYGHHATWVAPPYKRPAKTIHTHIRTGIWLLRSISTWLANNEWRRTGKQFVVVDGDLHGRSDRCG